MEEERLKALAIDIFVQQQRMVEGKVQDVYINITVGDVEKGRRRRQQRQRLGRVNSSSLQRQTMLAT